MTASIAPARRGFWLLRDIPTVLWLLAVVAVSLTHTFVPAPRWLVIHLLLLGAVTHSILVWSRYFTDALLHAVPTAADRQVQSRRLLLLNLGVVLVVVGVPWQVWPVTVAGATAVAAAVGWHGLALARLLRRALPARFGMTVRYYVGGAALLPVGAALGAAMAHRVGDPLHVRLMLAHVVVNLLGWVGLTVLGTLVTLWPTMLRTRIAEGSELAARRALLVLVVSVVVAGGGALAGVLPVVVLGLVGYMAGIGLLATPFTAAARRKLPSSYPTWSVLAGMLWLVGCLGTLVVGLATTTSWHVVDDRISAVTPALAAGFAAQVLLGALSYLVPVALGGGPSAARAANTVLERGGALRVAVINSGLPVALLPVPPLVRVLASTLVLAGLASFVPLLVLALRASRRAKGALQQGPSERRRAAPAQRRPG